MVFDFDEDTNLELLFATRVDAKNGYNEEVDLTYHIKTNKKQKNVT